MSGFVCEALGKHHDRQAFSCGIADLDDYLRRRARQDMRRRVAAVFVMVPEDRPTRIAGFYALSSASILLEALPEKFAKTLPRYPVVPAVLIGRLARDRDFPGVGRLLLVDGLARALRHCGEVAAAAVLVDVKNDTARRFYARYGFQEMPGASGRMFLPMAVIEQLLQSRGPAGTAE